MSRRFALITLALFLGSVSVAALAPGCTQSRDPRQSGSAGGGGQDELPPVLADFVVKADDPTLLFRYVDLASGEFATANTVAEVPEAARANVIVLSTKFPKGSMPAELVILTDLTAPAEDGTYAFRLVSRYGGVELPKAPSVATAQGSPSAPEPSAALAGSDSVILFSTQWCPHCRRARDWLKSQGIPFVEKDVESDATASALLRQMGQAQGIPAQMLTSVPILAVKGTLVMGFDQQKISALLQK